MIFGLFKKHCQQCGAVVKKRSLERFGKRFCSEEHAEAYSVEMIKAEPKNKVKKSCCG